MYIAEHLICEFPTADYKQFYNEFEPNTKQLPFTKSKTVAPFIILDSEVNVNTMFLKIQIPENC
jgi:hypothetical protein